jgi:hypothetical protein
VGHRFLTDDWIAAVMALQEEYRSRVSPPSTALRLNGTIRDVPFQDAPLAVNLDTSSGVGVVRRGHLDGADVTLTTDYETAKALFVTGQAQSLMTAFLDGRIVVQGDLSKLVTTLSGAGAADDVRTEIAERVRGLTELD